MSIGIYDADVANYTLVPFNLECMKISTYYKNRGEIVVMSPEFTPERHRKFFFRKDYEDGRYPPQLTQDNINYGGLALTNNIYKPLPLPVERLRPDVRLYEKYEDAFKQQGNRGATIYSQLMRSEHIRLSLDGKTLWSDYGTQFKNLAVAPYVILHDYNLGAVKGSYEAIQDILKRGRHDRFHTRIGMKFPVQVNTGEDLLKWSSLPAFTIFYSLSYNGIIPDKAFLPWVGYLRSRAVFKEIEYNVTRGSLTENRFIIDGLPKILEQVTISRSHRVFFSLKYDKDFFSDKRWCQVLDLFNFYMNSLKGTCAQFFRAVPEDTIAKFIRSFSPKFLAKYQGKSFTAAEAGNIVAFIANTHPVLFEKIQNCSAKSLGGEFSGPPIE